MNALAIIAAILAGLAAFLLACVCATIAGVIDELRGIRVALAHLARDAQRRNELDNAIGTGGQG